MTTGTWVLLVAVAAALAFGGYRMLTDGRFRGTHDLKVSPDDASAESAGASEPAVREETVWDQVMAALPDSAPGERATLVQFSSAFCAPCRATRRTLGEIADVVPGVAHLEIDAEHHLELVRTLSVQRTPTTLILNADGVEVSRAAGAPRKEQVLAALPIDAPTES